MQGPNIAHIRSIPMNILLARQFSSSPLLLGQRSLREEPPPYEAVYNEDEFEEGEYEELDGQDEDEWKTLVGPDFLERFLKDLELKRQDNAPDHGQLQVVVDQVKEETAAGKAS